MRMQHVRARKRQADTESQSSFSGLSGTLTETATAPTATGLLLSSVAFDAPAQSYSAPPIAGTSIPVVTSSPVPGSSTGTVTSAAPSATGAYASSSEISIGTVIGACVGAFAGAGVLICLLIYGCRRDAKQRAARAQRGLNAHGQSGESGSWKKLNEDTWEGKGGTVQRRDTMLTEKAFGMFKKSPSLYSAKTSSNEDHGFDLPPFEFSKYHPNLAAELAQPSRPFTGREDSGVSWDGSTVADDSFLYMHSPHAESGAMTPTMVMAKATPPATASAVHKWESAEVLTVENSSSEVQNPFSDVHSEQRKSVANPFFNAQEMQRARTRTRSRSNSARVSRARSGSDGPSRTPTVRERVHDPFVDVQDLPLTRGDAPPPFATHDFHDSIASGASGVAFGDRAMRSLIAALGATEEDVADRLRVATSESARTSTISGYSTMTGDGDIATVRDFPMPPASPHAHSSSGHPAV